MDFKNGQWIDHWKPKEGYVIRNGIKEPFRYLSTRPDPTVFQFKDQNFTYMTSRKLKNQYFDTPEGKNLFKKWCVGARNISLVVVPAAAYCSVIANTQPIPGTNTPHYISLRDWNWTKANVAFWSVMGIHYAAFTAGVVAIYVSNNIRKKDDCINYFLGGVSAGTTYGVIRGVRTGIHASVLIGLIATIAKAFQLAGETNWVPDNWSPRYGLFNEWRDWDFSWVADEYKKPRYIQVKE